MKLFGFVFVCVFVCECFDCFLFVCVSAFVCLSLICDALWLRLIVLSCLLYVVFDCIVVCFLLLLSIAYFFVVLLVCLFC